MNTLNRSRASSQRGFTLAEMMVVIVIIGLLATLVVPNVMQKFLQGQQGKAKADITTIASAVTEFAIQNGGKFPESLEILVTPDVNGYTFLNQKRVPKDPWGNEYQYEQPQSGQPEPRVFSLGKDGQPGGEGDAADIDNFIIRGDDQ